MRVLRGVVPLVGQLDDKVSIQFAKLPERGYAHWQCQLGRLTRPL